MKEVNKDPCVFHLNNMDEHVKAHFQAMKRFSKSSEGTKPSQTLKGLPHYDWGSVSRGDF